MKQFREVIAAHMRDHGFLAWNRNNPFRNHRGECFDRPSDAHPSLIECIDIDEAEGRHGYSVSAYLSITSAYGPPARLLRSTARHLHSDSLLFSTQRPTPAVFRNVNDFRAAFDAHVPDALRSQADLVHLRDFHLFLGGYSRKTLDTTPYRALGIKPSKRYLKEPAVLMLLEAYLGNFAQALKHLKEHGLPSGNHVTVELDIAAVPDEERRRLTAAELLKKYGHSTPVQHWEPVALADLEAGLFRARPANDVLREYARKDFVCGYLEMKGGNNVAL